MAKNVSFTVIMALVSLLMSSAAGASSKPALGLKTFEQACLIGPDKCIYARIRFTSIHSLFKQVRIYEKLKNQSDVNDYEEFVSLMLTPDKIPGVSKFSAKRYDGETHTWSALHLTKACQYCVSLDAIQKHGPEWIQTDFQQELSLDSNSFLSVGDVVRKGERLKIQIIVTAPNYVDPKNRSPIYIDSRIKGHHVTTSFIDGGITLDLDGDEVPWNFPDYVAISPVRSWADVAAKYRQREAVLVKDFPDLERSADRTPEQRLGRVARQLQAYRIRYDTQMGGAFPSQSPDQVIASRHGDCKALATLADALLQRVGLTAHVVILSEHSLPPLSFSVPGAFWNPLHVILYLPKLDLYIDPSRIAALGTDWKTSAETYRGAIGLDTTTEHFVVIH